MIPTQSLFDTGAAPVLDPAAQWIIGTLLGEVAIGLCVIAVAFVGFTMLTGHLPLRDALRVVIGCFVVLGAPVLAAGLRGAADDALGYTPVEAPTVSLSPEPAPLPPANYDPYAGASLRQD